MADQLTGFGARRGKAHPVDDVVQALLEEAHRQPKARAKSRVNRLGKVQRLKAKKVRGEVKANRGKPGAGDW